MFETVLRVPATETLSDPLRILDELRLAANLAQARLVLQSGDLWEARVSAALADPDGDRHADRAAVTDIAAVLGISHTAAHQMVTTMRELARLPALDEAFAEGAIDYAKTRTITAILRHASSETCAVIEHRVLRDAQHLTPGPLRSAVWAAWMSASPREAARIRAERRLGERKVYVRHGEDSMCWLSACLTSIEGWQAQALIDELATSVCEHDPRSTDTRRADALMALLHGDGFLRCQCNDPACPLATAAPPPRRAHLLEILVGIETLLGLSAEPATLPDGTPVDPEVVRTLANDATWRAILTEMQTLSQQHRPNLPTSEISKPGESPTDSQILQPAGPAAPSTPAVTSESAAPPPNTAPRPTPPAADPAPEPVEASTPRASLPEYHSPPTTALTEPAESAEVPDEEVEGDVTPPAHCAPRADPAPVVESAPVTDPVPESAESFVPVASLVDTASPADAAFDTGADESADAAIDTTGDEAYVAETGTHDPYPAAAPASVLVGAGAGVGWVFGPVPVVRDWREEFAAQFGGVAVEYDRAAVAGPPWFPDENTLEPRMPSTPDELDEERRWQEWIEQGVVDDPDPGEIDDGPWPDPPPESSAIPAWLYDPSRPDPIGVLAHPGPGYDPDDGPPILRMTDHGVVVVSNTDLAPRPGTGDLPTIAYLGLGRRHDRPAQLPPVTVALPVVPRSPGPGIGEAVDRIAGHAALHGIRVDDDGHGAHTQPPSGALTYRPSTRLAALVRAAFATCVFPGCSRPSSRCELDHRVPFDHHDPQAGGWTIGENLQPLCKSHHQHKTRRQWACHAVPGGIVWLSVTGIVRYTTTATIRTPAPGIPAPVPDPAPRAIAENPPLSREDTDDLICEPTWWDRHMGENAPAPPPHDTELRARYREHRAIQHARDELQPPPF